MAKVTLFERFGLTICSRMEALYFMKTMGKECKIKKRVFNCNISCLRASLFIARSPETG